MSSKNELLSPEERALKIVSALQVVLMGSYEADEAAWPAQGMSTEELHKMLASEIRADRRAVLESKVAGSS